MERAVAPAVLVALVTLAVAQGAIGGVAAEEVTLTITVVDSDGNTVSGIDLTATWNDSEGGPVTETTRANGQALLDVPRGSDVEIVVDDDEYIRNNDFVVFNAETEDVEIPVSLSGTATVTVEDGSGPVSGATVQFSQGVGQHSTDGQGQVTTERIEQGVYDVTVRQPGYLTNRTEINVTGDTERTVRLRRSNVEARFTVVDDHFEDPQPLDNATIEIPRLGTTLTTLSDGTRTTDVPVNRDYEVTVSKDGYGTETTTLTVGESSVSYEATIQRTPEITLQAAQGRVVVGESTTLTVTDQYDQRVEGATVSFEGDTLGTTDSRGEFVLGVERAGNITIRVTNGDQSASISIEGVEQSAALTATQSPTETTEPATATPTSDGGGGPGFGVLAAVLALVATLLLGRLR